MFQKKLTQTINPPKPHGLLDLELGLTAGEIAESLGLSFDYVIEQLEREDVKDCAVIVPFLDDDGNRSYVLDLETSIMFTTHCERNRDEFYYTEFLMCYRK